MALAQAAPSRDENLRHQILTYCVEHPDAKDTVSGILAWWFPGGRSHWSAEEVKNALEALITEGWMTSRSVRRSEEIFGVRKEKISEIKKILGGFTIHSD